MAAKMQDAARLRSAWQRIQVMAAVPEIRWRTTTHSPAPLAFTGTAAASRAVTLTDAPHQIHTSTLWWVGHPCAVINLFTLVAKL
eukprot:49736-Chlamydomonas_euryale.AAC.4